MYQLMFHTSQVMNVETPLCNAYQMSKNQHIYVIVALRAEFCALHSA